MSMRGGPGRDTAYDGQWNPRVGSYILPPLIGLPFHEMVKNGIYLPPWDSPWDSPLPPWFSPACLASRIPANAFLSLVQ